MYSERSLYEIFTMDRVFHWYLTVKQNRPYILCISRKESTVGDVMSHFLFKLQQPKTTQDIYDNV